MSEIDEQIYEYIKVNAGKHYIGCLLSDIEGRFARGATLYVDVWTSLSRLAKAKRIKKSGSHRYKGYVVTDITS